MYRFKLARAPDQDICRPPQCILASLTTLVEPGLGLYLPAMRGHCLSSDFLIAGAVPEMVQLLSSSSPKARNVAAQTLAKLIAAYPDARFGRALMPLIARRCFDPAYVPPKYRTYYKVRAN